MKFLDLTGLEKSLLIKLIYEDNDAETAIDYILERYKELTRDEAVDIVEAVERILTVKD